VERLKRTNSSYANLTKAQESQLTNLRQRLYQLKGADLAIDSERQANCDLTEQLAAAQEEIERLKATPPDKREDLRCVISDLCRQVQERDAKLASSEQLAAEQLNNKLLREALEAVIKVHGYKSGIPVEAISTQASTEALDKYVAEKVKEATTGHVEDIRFKNKEVEELRRIKMSRFNNEDCWIYQGDGEDHLESLSCPVVVYPSVLIELTKQRDLAVEAMQEALECGEDGDWQSARRILASVIKESGAK
jgi:hypothetical protein